MLEYLRQETRTRRLDNVTIVREDVRILPSLENGQIDLVISTSALHHLRDENGLRDVFRRIRSLLRPGGGFYIFDFGLLRSEEARQIFVAEVAKLAPPMTAHDYDLSLKAAFPVEAVLDLARSELPRPFEFAASAFFDIFYFLQTRPRTPRQPDVQAYIDRRWRELTVQMKAEHLMFRWFTRKTRVE
jgi:SAM-dependent methyltransferase